MLLSIAAVSSGGYTSENWEKLVMRLASFILAITLCLVGCSSAPTTPQTSSAQPENLSITSKQVAGRPGTVVVTVYPHSIAPGSVEVAAIDDAKVNSFHDYNEGENWKQNFNLWYGGAGIFGSPYFQIVVFSPKSGAVAAFKITFHGQTQKFTVLTP